MTNFSSSAAEREIVVTGAGGVRLGATLMFSDNSGAQPALLLVSGSGPTDRNGNQSTHPVDLLKQLAENLAAQGIATLRYDKRGIGEGEGRLPSDPVAAREFVRWNNFVEDTVAAFRLLRTQPGIDPNRTGILGHSEGGILAIEAADRLKDQPPAVLVLASTPGRKADVVLRDQLTDLMKRRGLSPAQIAGFLEQEDKITASLRDEDKLPENVPPGLAGLFPAYTAEFRHEEFLVDPISSIKRYDGPVLILQGGADRRVSPEKDAAALDAALSSRPEDHHRIAIIPGVIHPLKAIDQDTGPNATATPVAPEVFAVLDPWLNDNLVHSKLK